MKGTHLTIKYFGTLLVACAYDVQNHIFPIACCCRVENKDYWALFLVQLLDGIVDITLLLFLIDKKNYWRLYPLCSKCSSQLLPPSLAHNLY